MGETAVVSGMFLRNQNGTYGDLLASGLRYPNRRQSDGSYKFDISNLAPGRHQVKIETDAGQSNTVWFLKKQKITSTTVRTTTTTKRTTSTTTTTTTTTTRTTTTTSKKSTYESPLPVIHSVFQIQTNAVVLSGEKLKNPDGSMGDLLIDKGWKDGRYFKLRLV